ncbi:MAG: NAD(P)H-dependent flavin oxidoreductase [Candidatus Binataceae bacterium]
MRRFTKLATLCGIEHAIILAPMAGGTSTPELVAAVSNAGGLGSLGASYMAPGDIAQAIAAIRSLTNRPFAVNLFAGGFDGTGSVDTARMLELIAPHHERLGLPPPTAPAGSLPPFEQQVEVVLRAEVRVFSFTFGIPAEDVLRRMKQRGIKLMGTATTVAEARALEAAGVDAIVAQGSEAGAHRGSFLAPLEDSLVGTIALVPRMVDAVAVPIIASGGIMDGRGIAAAAALGASGVQMGTAFLVCPESGAPAVHKAAIRAARDDATMLTRAFSGRLARGLSNAFAASMRGHEASFLRYPAQNNLTRPMRTAAGKQGNADYLSLWAGQAAPMAREMPAADLVAQLVRETAAVSASLID